MALLQKKQTRSNLERNAPCPGKKMAHQKDDSPVPDSISSSQQQITADFE